MVSKCENCDHKDVCRFISKFRGYEESVKKAFPNGYDHPFRVALECTEFSEVVKIRGFSAINECSLNLPRKTTTTPSDITTTPSDTGRRAFPLHIVKPSNGKEE